MLQLKFLKIFLLKFVFIYSDFFKETQWALWLNHYNLQLFTVCFQ